MRKIVKPVYYIDFSFDALKLGGSAFAQTMNRLVMVPTVTEPDYFADAFGAVQKLITKNLVLAGHDISARYDYCHARDISP
ncbi:hypothetical protein MASR1M31_08150 [Porphyromonadaceae bacterium]